MDFVELRAAEWRSGPVLVARSFFHRWRGLRPRTAGRAMWVPGRSITTFGMRESIGWAALGVDGLVLETGVTSPRRIVLVRCARAFVEFDASLAPPDRGSHVSIVTRCPAG